MYHEHRQPEGRAPAATLTLVLLAAAVITATVVAVIAMWPSQAEPMREISVRRNAVSHRVLFDRKLTDAASLEEDVLRNRVSAAVDGVEKRLGSFERGVTIQLRSSVSRPGENLGRAKHWTGRVQAAKGEPTLIEIRADELRNESELRFYLALARMKEMDAAVPPLLIRVGIAHRLRSEDGRDAGSIECLKRSGLLPTNRLVDAARVKIDPEYRDKLRGTGWAVVYLLERRGMELKEIMGLAAERVPDLEADLEKLKEETAK